MKSSAGENLGTVKAEESDVVEKPTAPTPEEVTVHTTAFYEVKRALEDSHALEQVPDRSVPVRGDEHEHDDIVQYKEVLSSSA